MRKTRGRLKKMTPLEKQRRKERQDHKPGDRAARIWARRHIQK